MAHYPQANLGGKKPHEQAPRTLSSVNARHMLGAIRSKNLIAIFLAGASGPLAAELRCSIDGFNAIIEKTEAGLAFASHGNPS